MSYDYNTERDAIFTEEGQRMFLQIRDAVQAKLKLAGAVRVQEAMSGSGNTWEMMACFDRMVELGEIREITDPTKVCGQHRVFVSAKGDT